MLFILDIFLSICSSNKEKTKSRILNQGNQREPALGDLFIIVQITTRHIMILFINEFNFKIQLKRGLILKYELE